MFVLEYVETYLANVLYQSRFILNNYNSELEDYRAMSRNLLFSSFKCAVLSSTMFMMYRFSRGRQHYLQYIKSLVLGGTFGVGYSVYYNDHKLMDFLSKQIAIEEYIDEKRKELNKPAVK